MEKQIAFVNKISKRVEKIIIVDSYDKKELSVWESNDYDVIPLKDSIAFLHGLFDGEKFYEPDNEYLIEIGLLTVKSEKEIEQELQQQAERQAILDRLGLTADEAKLILG